MKTIVNNPSDLITLKEFKELHSKRRSKTLTPFEKYKIMCTLKSPIEVLILSHLYTKFLHFDMKEFHQRKFDIQVGTSNYSENTITNNLNSLERKGYFTSEFKTVKGKQYKRLHFNINLKIMNEFLTVGEDLKPENFSNLIENLRREYETVEENPYTKKPNPTKEPVLSDSKDFKSSDELEPTKKETTQPEPPKEATEPIKAVQWMTFESNNVNNDNITKTGDFMKEEIREEDFNEVTKLFIKYKDIEGVKPVLNDLMLSFDTINYLYSNDYVAGVDKRLDDKKATLEILYSIKIEPLLNK